MRSSNTGRHKYMIRTAAATLAAVMIAVLTACSCTGGKEQDTTGTTQTQMTEQSQAFDNTVEWKGKKYRYNRNLTNILFLGIDKTEDLSTEDIPGTAGQADSIMILSLDSESSEGRILQINRNTMTQIDIYDRFGNFVNTMDGQLTLQFAYSIGGDSSCHATKKTVSELLFGLEIDGYFALNLEGLSKVNDAIGGVDVTMKADYTFMDPLFKEGETVHLDGDKAERFVRYRDTSEFNSVQNRMERQAEYVTALVGRAKSVGGSFIYDVLSPFFGKEIITDLDADQMNALRQYTYLTDDIKYLPGEMKMGEKFEEYYLDEEKLQELIMEMFYKEVLS